MIFASFFLISISCFFDCLFFCSDICYFLPSANFAAIGFLTLGFVVVVINKYISSFFFPTVELLFNTLSHCDNRKLLT